MTITVNTPDGGTASFPDGTDTGTITSAMQSKFGGPSGGGTPDTGGKQGSFIQSLASSATLGGSDWLGAGIGELMRDTGWNPQASTHAQIVAQNEQYAKENPGKALAANVLGVAPAMLIPGGAEGEAASWLAGKAGVTLGPKMAQALGSAGTALGADVTSHELAHGELPTGGEAALDVLGGGALGGVIGGRARNPVTAATRAGGKLGSGTLGVGDALSDLVGPEVRGPVAKTEDQLSQELATQYARNKTIPAPPAATVQSGIDGALNSMSVGERAQMSAPMQRKLDYVSNLMQTPGTNMSVDDLDGIRRSITDLANKTGANGDKIAGARIGDMILQMGGQPLQDANMAAGRLRDAQWLGKATPSEAMAIAAQKTAPGAGVAMQPAGRDALTELANMQPKGVSGAISKGMDIGQAALAAHAGQVGAGLGGVGGFVGGGPIGAAVGAPLGAIGGSVASAVANKLMSLARQRDVKRQMKAALAASSTGQQATGAMYQGAPWLSQGLRTGLYSQDVSARD